MNKTQFQKFNFKSSPHLPNAQSFTTLKTSSKILTSKKNAAISNLFSTKSLLNKILIPTRDIFHSSLYCQFGNVNYKTLKNTKKEKYNNQFWFWSKRMKNLFFVPVFVHIYYLLFIFLLDRYLFEKLLVFTLPWTHASKKKRKKILTFIYVTKKIVRKFHFLLFVNLLINYSSCYLISLTNRFPLFFYIFNSNFLLLKCQQK